jgi:hypothetical protein
MSTPSSLSWASYLSEVSSHQKAYKELLAHVDNGHAITIDKVQNAIILFCHSSESCAFACLRPTNLRSTDSVNPRAVLSRVRPRYTPLRQRGLCHCQAFGAVVLEPCVEPTQGFCFLFSFSHHTM